VALEDSDDENHESAIEFRERLRNSLTPFRSLYTSNYIIDETLTLLKERCGVSVAVSFREDLEKSSVVRVLWLEPEVEREAWRIFKTHREKGYSFTDCTSFALMDAQAVKNAFAYDGHFRQYGFVMHP
jgi:predicted nucleic acid-binding protein